MFRQVLQTDPRAAAVSNNLGILEMNAVNRRDAADAFRQAVTADPDYAAAWQGLGVALTRLTPPSRSASNHLSSAVFTSRAICSPVANHTPGLDFM